MGDCYDKVQYQVARTPNPQKLRSSILGSVQGKTTIKPRVYATFVFVLGGQNDFTMACVAKWGRAIRGCKYFHNPRAS